MGVMLTINKVFTIIFLLCLWEQRIPWQFSKQLSKLFFQIFKCSSIFSPWSSYKGEEGLF